MKISTKSGDNGLTSLLCGERVRKDNLRVEMCGALDELNSFLGLSKSLLKDRAARRLIGKVQQDLFAIGSEIAASISYAYKLPNRIEEANVRGLELFIEKLEKKCRSKRSSFILPGKNTLSATLDIARSIARRAERRTVTLSNRGKLKNKHIIIYLNRLSDLLYLLARSCEGR